MEHRFPSITVASAVALQDELPRDTCPGFAATVYCAQQTELGK
jgi:hypothetical protein